MGLSYERLTQALAVKSFIKETVPSKISLLSNLKKREKIKKEGYRYEF